MTDIWSQAGDSWSVGVWNGAGDAAGESCDAQPVENKKGCFICGEEGHRKADCPQGGDGERKRRGCFNCGEEGHNKADCPNPPNNDGRGGDFNSNSRECFNCKEIGHFSRDCPNPKEPDDPNKIPNAIYQPEEVSVDDLYQLQGVSSGINFSKYEKIQVKSSGENVPNVVRTFDELGLRPLLMENIGKCGYKVLTPVQKCAIPCVLANRDVMACAQTGSGKTAAFLIPIIQNLLQNPSGRSGSGSLQHPAAVVIAPTRELAIQIQGEAKKFAAGSNIRCVVVYGGTSVRYQLENVQRGVDILIATCGRLGDFLNRGNVEFDQVRYLVLDEADRMLEQGNLEEVKTFVNRAGMLPKGDRVTLMFSATFPEEVQTVAKELLQNYVFLAVGIVGAACDDVKQTVLEVSRFEKKKKILDILKEIGDKKTIIFAERKTDVDRLGTLLCDSRVKATTIHGDRLQQEREQALGAFRRGDIKVLVATAVASRGLDIKGVEHVINYDLPKTIDEYVHRIGRTGRLGNEGRATSFFDASSNFDAGIASTLVDTLIKSNQEVPEFLKMHAGVSLGVDSQIYGASDIRCGTNGDGGIVEDDGWI